MEGDAMARPEPEMILDFEAHVGRGYAGDKALPIVTLRLRSADQQEHLVFGFLPGAARKIADELLDVAEQAEGQGPPQN
jgi:hypothetical protein